MSCRSTSGSMARRHCICTPTMAMITGQVRPDLGRRRYLLNDRLLVGLAFHADFMDDLTDTTTIEGQGHPHRPLCLDGDRRRGVPRCQRLLRAALKRRHHLDLWRFVLNGTAFGQGEPGGGMGLERSADAAAEGQRVLPAGKRRPIYRDRRSGQRHHGGRLHYRAVPAFGRRHPGIHHGPGLRAEPHPYIGGQLGLSLTTDNPAGAFTTLSTGFDLLGLATGLWAAPLRPTSKATAASPSPPGQTSGRDFREDRQGRADVLIWLWSPWGCIRMSNYHAGFFAPANLTLASRLLTQQAGPRRNRRSAQFFCARSYRAGDQQTEC
jgi:hypothetical protein